MKFLQSGCAHWESQMAYNTVCAVICGLGLRLTVIITYFAYAA
jgi:hypothetical protein